MESDINQSKLIKKISSEDCAEKCDVPLDLPFPSDGAESLFFLFLLGRVPDEDEAGPSSVTSMNGRMSPVLSSRVRFEDELKDEELGRKSGVDIVEAGERARIGDLGTLGGGDKDRSSSGKIWIWEMSSWKTRFEDAEFGLKWNLSVDKKSVMKQTKRENVHLENDFGSNIYARPNLEPELVLRNNEPALVMIRIHWIELDGIFVCNVLEVIERIVPRSQAASVDYWM